MYEKSWELVLKQELYAGKDYYFAIKGGGLVKESFIQQILLKHFIQTKH